MIRALLFDFDGLLLDTEGPCYRAWAEVYRAHGHDLPLDAWCAAVGTVGGFDPVAHLEELSGVRLDTVAREAKRRRELDLCALEELRPGVSELLAQAAVRGLRTAVVSSSPRDWIMLHLERRGLLDRFDAVLCADGDLARAKPRPVLYQEALATLEVNPGEAVAFEDSPHGITAAKAAGVRCVAVPNDITRALDLTAADEVLESLLEVRLGELEQRLSAAA